MYLCVYARARVRECVSVWQWPLPLPFYNWEYPAVSIVILQLVLCCLATVAVRTDEFPLSTFSPRDRVVFPIIQIKTSLFSLILLLVRLLQVLAVALILYFYHYSAMRTARDKIKTQNVYQCSRSGLRKEMELRAEKLLSSLYTFHSFFSAVISLLSTLWKTTYFVTFF